MNEQGYLELLQDVLDHGHFKPVERTGVGSWSMFGKSLRFDLRDSRLPMLTTKKMFFKGIFIFYIVVRSWLNLILIDDV